MSAFYKEVDRATARNRVVQRLVECQNSAADLGMFKLATKLNDTIALAIADSADATVAETAKAVRAALDAEREEGSDSA